MTEGFEPKLKNQNETKLEVFDKRSFDLQRLILETPEVVELLIKLREAHQDTYEHSLRVGLSSIDLGYELGLDESQLKILGYASNLHDVGKMHVDLNIIDKKGKLDDVERLKMRAHVRKGFLLLNHPELETAKEIMAQHHEYQIKPYPRKLNDRREEKRDFERRSDNPITKRLGEILHIADMADALTSARSYKEPLSKKVVEEILRSEFVGDQNLIDRILLRIKY